MVPEIIFEKEFIDIFTVFYESKLFNKCLNQALFKN